MNKKKHTIMIRYRFLMIALCLSCLQIVQAAVTLPVLVSDGMILQRDAVLPVWGWAQPGTVISVRFRGKEYKATTDKDGQWSTRLDKCAAGGPYDMQISGDGSNITVKNILLGDVWLCSGQSNMVLDFNNKRANELYATDRATSANDAIRQILISRTYSSTPARDAKSNGWKAASPASLPAFSLAAYFFARELNEKYKVPVGIINTSYGGTKIEAWTSEEALKDFTQFNNEIFLLHDTAALNTKILAAQQRINEWNANNKADSTHRPPGKFNPQDLATSLYNAMIAPLIPYAIKGTLWYQGEYNAVKAYDYRALLPNLIKDWRSRWQQGDFPFIFQQLPNFKPAQEQPVESQWAELREAQLMTLSRSPNTAMSVGIDVGEADDIHPVNKKDIGHRLFLAAAKLAYGEKKLIANGPVYQSMKIQGNTIVIRFDKTGGQLSTNDGKPLRRFAIAGADKKFVWATAVIKGNTIEVSADQVTAPVAVRYAWADNPAGCNLYNSEGLPASPFRTDDWPGITVPKK